MARRSLSLSSRIFFYMILLVVLASILIAAVTIYQYKEQSQDYHRLRLERKEAQLISSINYVLKESSWEIKTENLGIIFNQKIYEIANIHNVAFNLYDLEGKLIKSSRPWLDNNPVPQQLDVLILDTLDQISAKRFVEKNKLLDDAVYSDSKARMFLRRGYSLNKIAHSLKAKGVDQENIKVSIEKIKNEKTDPDLVSAMKLCKKRRIGPMRPGTNRELFYKKDMGILARSGFNFSISKKILDMDYKEYIKLLKII